MLFNSNDAAKVTNGVIGRGEAMEADPEISRGERGKVEHQRLCRTDLASSIR
jgi:hypothetical protein